MNSKNKKYLEKVKNLSYVLESYMEFKSQSIKEKLAEKTFEMFKRLVNADIYEKIEIDDDYQVSLISNKGNIQTHLSSGQKQVLMTSFVWGLEQCSEYELPIIIDTPLARLDPIHRKNMLTHYFPNASHQVIILSQPSEIDDTDKEDPEFSSHFKDERYIKLEMDPLAHKTTIFNCQI